MDPFEEVCEDNLPLEDDPVRSENFNKNLEALRHLPDQYADLVKKYPDILQSRFKEEPNANIYHRIDTGDSEPHKCKVRPLLASSEKSQEGKKIWIDMEKMGVIERVKSSSVTQMDESSAFSTKTTE